MLEFRFLTRYNQVGGRAYSAPIFENSLNLVKQAEVAHMESFMCRGAKLLIVIALLGLAGCWDGKDQNLIEYSDGIDFSRSYPVLKGVEATANVNLREKPNTNSRIIATIPAGAVAEARSLRHTDGWFHVMYEGDAGWVHGKYLRLGQGLDRLGPVKRGVGYGLKYAFPEGAWWKKILGVLGGLLIGVIAGLIGLNGDKGFFIVFSASWTYFLLKNMYIVRDVYGDAFGVGNLLGLSLVVTGFTFISSWISTGIVVSLKES